MGNECFKLVCSLSIQHYSLENISIAAFFLLDVAVEKCNRDYLNVVDVVYVNVCDGAHRNIKQLVGFMLDKKHL